MTLKTLRQLFTNGGPGAFAWLPFAVLAVLLLTVNCGFCQALNLLGDDDDDDDGDGEKSYLSRKMNLDMMYGTDDFFGENSDLSYADRVTPSGTTPDKSSTQPETTLDKGDDDDDDDDDDDKGDSGGGGGPDPGGGGDDDDDPGDDPGGGGDEPPPPPDCPD